MGDGVTTISTNPQNISSLNTTGTPHSDVTTALQSGNSTGSVTPSTTTFNATFAPDVTTVNVTETLQTENATSLPSPKPSNVSDATTMNITGTLQPGSTAIPLPSTNSSNGIGSDVFHYGREASELFLEELQSKVLISNIDVPNQEKGSHDISVNSIIESLINELNETQLQSGYPSELITIAIGSTSRENANRIANNTEGIDIILYSGNCSVTENSTDFMCWDTVNKTNDKTTYVGSLGMKHADIAHRFLVGEVQITFGENCSIENIEHNHFNYANVTRDRAAPNLAKKLFELNYTLTENMKNLTGERENCSVSECLLGNLVTDSMLLSLKGNDFWNGNGSRIAVFPAAQFQVNKTVPQDMLQVQYNTTTSKNLDFLSVKTVPASSASMKLEPIDLSDNNTLYTVTMPFSIFKMEKYEHLLSSVNESRIIFHNVTVVEAMINFMGKEDFLTLPLVGYRQIKFESPPSIPEAECPSNTGTTILVTLVVTALFLGGCYGVWWYVFRRNRPRTSSTMAMMNMD
ncbi:hypothetical protein C0J52_03901 [Blattella germanica]|nr:hypothetical protein C0J52_03901 [Blattella germanica]